jgi:L-seryl-tRNA(Ser) seleniumtransferase
VSRTQNKLDLFRMLPSVDELLRAGRVVELAADFGNAAVTDAARAVLIRVRQEISSERLDRATLTLAISNISEAIERELRTSFKASLRRVINGTGVVLHTNLGRAPLPMTAVEHILRTATSYSNLEFDLGTGERGKRDAHVQRLFARLLSSSAQHAIQTVVVNNCAAAVLLALNTLAEGGEVIVSRGELVEIGGSFRVPEVMAKSGATLREVGTTNRTRISDYADAITDRTKLILRVHRSNFAIVGFTEQPSMQELVALGQARNIPVLEDLGNGSLFDLRQVGVNDEPGVHESLRAGVDVLTYSGDKLLGGPQAGIISGKAELVAKIRANPLFRALRVDKLTYAALEATLLEYLRGNLDRIPAVALMRTPVADLEARAEALAGQLTANTKLRAEVIRGESLVGGGTAPTATLPTALLALTHEAYSADALQTRLRSAEPPVIVRVDEGRVLIDLRTVFQSQIAELTTILKNI